MYAKVTSLGVTGLAGYIVQVEADLSGGLPQFNLVGLPDSAVKESSERVRSAIKNLHYEWPASRITINLAPADVRARVMAARALQRERYKALPGVRCNAQLPSGALRRYCRMTPAAEKILRSAFERLGYSARAYDRILRVARTVADLDGSEVLDTAHLSETLQYRTLDRKFGM